MISRSATRSLKIIPAPAPRSAAKSRRKVSALGHAVRLIHHVCCLAGSASIMDNLRAEASGLTTAIAARDTAALFDRLAADLSYQGIADSIAYAYMEAHGIIAFKDIAARLASDAACPKLGSYWSFHGCRYSKSRQLCARPQALPACPLPCHDLRNGHLNQMAYSLFLFVRDIAEGDLVGWIDRQLATAANQQSGPERAAALRTALLEPLREVYGVSNKVLSMALSQILLAAPPSMPLWLQAGASLIAVDTLVHNFLARTGILSRFRASHPYGPGCYRRYGCADIIEAVAARIDARAFNPSFPATFPRFVQQAIWRYCAQSVFDVCNGNRIDDRRRCGNVYCQLYNICDRRQLNVKN